jgi:Fe-S-cluster-containing dehydrogenase component
MTSYVIDQDQKRCIGCRACEIHCKTEKGLPVGPRLCQIVEVGPRVIKQVPRIHFQFMPCFHCEKASCVSACPTGAMNRREEDGIVFVDRETCVGCKTCIISCPWGVPQWDEETGTVVKCDYCKDRIDAGLEPACVTGCTTKALTWTKPAGVTARKRRQTAQDIADSAVR